MNLAKLTLLSVLFALGGCARLNVTVDVYNRLGQSAQDAAEAQAANLALQHQAAVKTGHYSLRKQALDEGLSSLVDKLVGARLIPKSSRAASSAAYFATVDKMVETLIADRDDAARTVAQAEAYYGTARTRTYQRALHQFAKADEAWTASWKRLRGDVDIDIEEGRDNVKITVDEVIRANPAVRTAITNLEQLAAKPRQDLLTAGLGLFTDPFASRIVTAPEKFWRGEYNRAYGTGIVGNTNLAIQMEGPAMFTVKGLKQDSSKLTKASLQVLKQGVQMVGAAYGLPVGAVQGTAVKPAVSAVNSVTPTSFADPLASVTPLTRGETAKLLGDILSQRQALEGSPAAREAALDGIRQRVKSLTPSAP